MSAEDSRIIRTAMTQTGQRQVTQNLEQIARETVDCAARIREIIDTEQFPKDELWIPTIRAHASVILDNLTALRQVAPQPAKEEVRRAVPHPYHAPCTTRAEAVDRLTTLIKRLRYKGDTYNADIAELEVAPYLAAPQDSGQADTKRLDWLGSKAGITICRWHDGYQLAQCCTESSQMTDTKHPTLRAAIDSAANGRAAS